MDRLRHLLCALRGHEEYLRFESNRMFLECGSCGYESPGWTVDRKTLAPRPTAAPRALQIAPPALRQAA